MLLYSSVCPQSVHYDSPYPFLSQQLCGAILLLCMQVCYLFSDLKKESGKTYWIVLTQNELKSDLDFSQEHNNSELIGSKPSVHPSVHFTYPFVRGWRISKYGLGMKQCTPCVGLVIWAIRYTARTVWMPFGWHLDVGPTVWKWYVFPVSANSSKTYQHSAGLEFYFTELSHSLLNQVRY